MRTTIDFHGAKIVLTCCTYVLDDEEGSETTYYVFHKGRRSYLDIECANNDTFSVNGVGYIASSSGRLFVDVTDVVQGGAREAETMTIGYGGYTMTLQYMCVEGLHPEEANMLAPNSSEKCLQAGHFVYSLAGKVYFSLPNVILRSPLFAMYENVPMLNFPIWRDELAGEGTLTIDTEETSVVEYDDEISLYADAKNIILEDLAKTLNIHLTEASETPVMVQWLSSVGAWTDKSGRNEKIYKRALWDMISNKASNTTRVLQTISAGYDFQRGTSNEITIQIKGLTAYGLWYYSDIVNSSDVRVIFKNGNELLFADSKAMPTNKDVTTRYGNDGTYYDLSVTLKVLNYDTI